jgi:nucleotidyltransferase/DNA polymerase involved in DNA repair
MDYFFAACEELRHPELKGKPFVVGSAPAKSRDRGVVETCNYETRALGIHSAMPMNQALRLKPDLVYIESDDKYYMDMSEKVMKILKDFGFRMEVVSIDEAALGLGEMDYGKAEELARSIKQRLGSGMGLPCTIGIAPGKVYAKMVCDKAKPNGIGVLRSEDLKAFLKDKKVEALLGVGRKTAEKLKEMRIGKISELAKADPNVLIDSFGSFGKELFLLANGIDESRIEEKYDVLSIGRERTLDSYTNGMDSIARLLKELTKEMIDEVRRQQMWFKGISVKVKYTDMTERIKNRSLSNYSDSFESTYRTALELMKELVGEKQVRKVGVRVYAVESRKGQRAIFEN